MTTKRSWPVVPVSIAVLAIILVLIIGTRSVLLPGIIIAPLFLTLVWLAGLMSFFGIAIIVTVTISLAAFGNFTISDSPSKRLISKERSD